MGSGEQDIVYVLINEAMPGYVKVGKTDSIDRRLRDLDWTNLPLPFECFYAAKVADASFVETQLLEAFGDNRVRAKREFLVISPERVVAALRLAALQDVTPRADVAVSEEVRHDLEEAHARRAAFNFEMVQIPVGATLTFTRDPNVTATVVDNRRVTFNGANRSLSDAALLALRAQGLNWPRVQGPLYWQYEGETLDERRRRMEEGVE
jgi:T5orf172 domain-containing protein